MTPIFLLGDFEFRYNGASIREVDRRTSWQWGRQEQIGLLDALQAMGRESDTIRIPGVVYPYHYQRGGTVEELRELGNQQRPLTLVDGDGNFYGLFVIEELTEKRTSIVPGGGARKQEFVLTLRKFADG